MVNNLYIVEIDGRIGPMRMAIRVTSKQVQEYNKIILLQ